MTASTTLKQCRKGIIIMALAMVPLLAGGCHGHGSSMLLGAGIGALAGYAISEDLEHHRDRDHYHRSRHSHRRHHDGHRSRYRY